MNAYGEFQHSIPYIQGKMLVPAFSFSSIDLTLVYHNQEIGIWAPDKDEIYAVFQLR